MKLLEWDGMGWVKGVPHWEALSGVRTKSPWGARIMAYHRGRIGRGSASHMRLPGGNVPATEGGDPRSLAARVVSDSLRYTSDNHY